MHLTLKKEATRPAGENFLQQQNKFDAFVERFNRERPHQGIGMKTPADLYRPSSTAYLGLPDLDCPLRDRSVAITICARICIGKHKVNVSQVFAGQSVGVTEVADRIWLVSFMHYDLGFLDDQNCRLESVASPFEVRNVLPMSRE